MKPLGPGVPNKEYSMAYKPDTDGVKLLPIMMSVVVVYDGDNMLISRTILGETDSCEDAGSGAKEESMEGANAGAKAFPNGPPASVTPLIFETFRSVIARFTVEILYATMEDTSNKLMNPL